MNEMQNSSSSDMKGNSMNGTEDISSTSTDSLPVFIENDDEPTVIESEAVSVTDDDVAQIASDNEVDDDADPVSEGLSAEEISEAAFDIAESMDELKKAVSAMEDSDFDRIRAITRFLMGGVMEGADEFTNRLQIWQEFLRQEMPETSSQLSDASEQELMRYALVGLIFESGDTGRHVLKNLLKISGNVTKTAVRPAKFIMNRRLMSPFRRRLDRMADRGEEQLMRWIQRGYDEEPLSRNMARLGVQEITNEFIDQLAQNEEVKELIQEQSIGLAGEAVEQVRERTFTADSLVERIARAVTRRSPRLEPPMADLSEYPKKLPSGLKTGDES